MADRVVRYIITGESAGAVRAMKNVEDSAKKTESSLAATGKTLKSTGAGMVSLGSTMMKVGLPFLAAGAYSVKMGMDFQRSMTLLQTNAGASAKQVKQLESGILDMRGLEQTPQELASGMFHVVSAMNASIPASQRVSGELEIQKQAAIGAAIGQGNLEETTYALVSAMNAVHAPWSNARKVMSEVNAVVGAGDMHLEDFVGALSSGFLPTAQQFGISLLSLGAAEDTMTQSGQPAEQSATRLRMAISLLGAPTSKAAKLLETQGLASSEVHARTLAMSEMLAKAGMRTTHLAEDLRRPDGIMVALQDLKTHLTEAGLAAPEQAAFISRAFGGGRTSGGIMALYHDLPAVVKNYNNELKIAGQYTTDERKERQTAVHEWGELKATVAKAGIEIGTKLLPDVKDFAKFSMGIIDDFSKLPKWVIMATFGMSAASFMAGGLLVIFGNIYKMVGGLVTVLGDFAGAEATAGANGVLMGSGVSAGLAPILGVTAALVAAYGAVKGIQGVVNLLHPGSLQQRSVTEDMEILLYGHTKVHPKKGEDRAGLQHPHAAGGLTVGELGRKTVQEAAWVAKNWRWRNPAPSPSREVTLNGTEYIMNHGEALNPSLAANVMPSVAAKLPEYLQIHTHVNLDSRQIVEAIERFSLKRAVRR